MKLAKLPNGSPEIFYTIQGEGINTGKPSTFIRLSLCNLNCHWCDTPYTWNWEGTPWETTSGVKYNKKDYIIDYTISEVIAAVSLHPCKNLVITGGEPLIQQKEISELIKTLGSDWTVEIETNGTIKPDKLPLKEYPVQFNVSPKLSHSGNSPEKALVRSSLEWFGQHPSCTFKFVIASEADIEEIQTLQAEFTLPSSKIVLMPKGTSSETIKGSSLEIANLCLEHGYRFSDRLHVHLWGNERAR